MVGSWGWTKFSTCKDLVMRVSRIGEGSATLVARSSMRAISLLMEWISLEEGFLKHNLMIGFFVGQVFMA